MIPTGEVLDAVRFTRNGYANVERSTSTLRIVQCNDKFLILFRVGTGADVQLLTRMELKIIGRTTVFSLRNQLSVGRGRYTRIQGWNQKI